MTALSEGYRRPAILLHWIITVLVLLMIPAGLVMIQQGLPRPVQDTLFIFHKNTGLLVLMLMLLRLIWRWRHPPPPLPDTVPGWQRRATEAVHLALYVLLILMPLSGYVRVRAGRFPIEALDAMGIGTLLPESKMLASAAQTIHMVCAFALIGLVCLHVAAALHHAILRRDGVFSRMWPPNGRKD